MDSNQASVLAGLTPDQRAAVEAVTGPVCILAGAGSGKTTTITRRIAWQVMSGAFTAREILALTFTDRAAQEMRGRLDALGAGAVRARTFHSEALAQVAFFGGSPQILPSKAVVLGPLVRRLPRPYRFRATKDVAAEIEWAKNRRLSPSSYADEVPSGRTTPLPVDLMVRVYGEYERRKGDALDFEDLLGRCIALLDENAEAAGRIRGRYRAFTVDEYQDVNLLQQTLLDAWLDGREDVCVVGDDYQSIYGFTGATPEYLLGFARRHPAARTVTLAHSHRSAPQILDVANRLVPRLQGSAKRLEATRPPGVEPVIREFSTGLAETAALVDRIRELHASGTPLEEIAVLYRINARSEDYEEAFARAGITYQVRDGAFLRRPGPRTTLARLRKVPPNSPAGPAVEAAARSVGWEPDIEPDGAEEATRQADLGRLVRLAGPHDTVGAFLADLKARFEDQSSGRGVVLSTYHRAKGCEWEAVFLPRLEERELPFALSKTDEEITEERRLLYVGITRAKDALWLSWARLRDDKSVRPSRFVSEILPAASDRAPGRPPPATTADPELFERLRAWRRRTAAAGNVPAYVVLHDTSLRAIAEARPSSLVQLGRLPGLGPVKLSKWGTEILQVVSSEPSG